MQQNKQKTGKGHCPHCKDGFVIKEPQLGPAPPGFHCIICGWYEWLSFPKHPEREPDPPSLEPQVKRSHKKAQKDLKRAMKGVTL